MKILTLAGAAFTIMLSFDYMKRERLARFEYPVLILLSTAGMMLTISANDLISLYLALEFQSLALYVLAAFRRDNLRSTEAGLKYFVLGALSSGLLLYGSSLIYGYTGARVFPRSPKPSSDEHGAAPSALSSASSSCWRALPSRSRRCRSICGRPTSMKARRRPSPPISRRRRKCRPWRWSSASSSALSQMPPVQWQQIIIAISVASMALGAFAAIGQQNIKRLLAYSSIGHVGYALIGLAAATPQGAPVDGISSVLIYLTIYLAMTLGSFACILAMRQGHT